ncbi:calcium-binding protein [Pseudoprimorskyibacter insulae]|uniref:EF-hand domain-containing protein n=1 Tax=Pseudoprimorskyibacter insulae TaxID=1695997 RepID=A0A2R8AP85_9RHOB|nr:calcium-binding protein [Pseudoprimorskyibacter insulae]SPF77707.1 hypothetical protein PRI8871_00291 [Pseudoprimorskyibacter insulae]
MKRFALATAFVLTAGLAQAAGQPGLHFVENWDLDSDGQVTLAEATERRGDIFTTFDADENGVLSAVEYADFDAARAADMEGQQGHGNGNMKRADGGMALAFNDLDGDGQVSREEFLSRVPAWFAQMDRSGDGVITTMDFGRKG